ncbi:hypothetical protein E6C27_scaffold128G002810 [Cucumis melo var. makuwa]|uniref:Uncharacterized protein n=1 Tax=Cucumis melo var. makuwa TaxID=1194695 RepID=A0A5A7TIV5_CUCMM|nr:hypothetical protein E6C27_scaffold128G002810 [Cucumis melo var. makuwa]
MFDTCPPSVGVSKCPTCVRHEQASQTKVSVLLRLSLNRSSFLFLLLLVVDVISKIISMCVEGNVYELLEVGEDRVGLSHLQFAGDTRFLFWRGAAALAFFEETLGLRIIEGG